MSKKKKALEAKKEYAKLSKQFFNEAEKADKKIFVGCDIMKTIAQQCTDDEWVHFYHTGEVPSVKLSAQQMSNMKGGGWLTDFKSSVKSYGNNLASGAKLGVSIAKVYTNQKFAEAKYAGGKIVGGLNAFSNGMGKLAEFATDLMVETAEAKEEEIWGEKDPWGLKK